MAHIKKKSFTGGNGTDPQQFKLMIPEYTLR